MNMRLKFLIFIISFLSISSSYCSDFVQASPEALVRRLFVDLYNRTPSVEELKTAQEMIQNGKYSNLVNQMLINVEFKYNAAGKLIEHFAPKVERQNLKEYKRLQTYIQDKYIGQKKDLRDLISDILNAKGIMISNQMILFYGQNEKPPDLAGRFAERILGLPLQCARCHDHPEHKKLKQTKFWELAAFFQKTSKRFIRRKKALQSIEANMKGNKKQSIQRLGKKEYVAVMDWIQAEKDGRSIYANLSMEEAMGKVKKLTIKALKSDILLAPQMMITEEIVDLQELTIHYKVDGEDKVSSAILPGKSKPPKGYKAPRKMLSKWLVAKKNPYFAKATVNWVVAWLMGRGFVMPVYDIYGGAGVRDRELKKFANKFKSSKYNLTKLVRFLVNSKYYKMKSAYNDDEEKFVSFEKRRLRHLTGEQIINSLLYQNVQKLKSQNTEQSIIRRFHIERNKLALTEKFFPTSLENTETNYKGTLGQTLYMSNNSNIIRHAEKMARMGFNQRKTIPANEWLKGIFQKLYSRTPNIKEEQFFAQKLKSQSFHMYFNVVWSLMNSPEMRLY